MEKADIDLIIFFPFLKYVFVPILLSSELLKERLLPNIIPIKKTDHQGFIYF